MKDKLKGTTEELEEFNNTLTKVLDEISSASK